MSAELDQTMIGAISSGTNQVAGALLALINPRATGQSEPRARSTSVDGVLLAEATNGPVGKSELTEEEPKGVEQLKKRDAEVRRHEQALDPAGSDGAANAVGHAGIARTTNTAGAAIASPVAMLEAPGRFLGVTVCAYPNNYEPRTSVRADARTAMTRPIRVDRKMRYF